MTVYGNRLTSSKTGQKRMARVRRWLRRCDEVCVWSGPEIGFTTVTKKEAAKLLRQKGEELTARYSGEPFCILFIEPIPF